MSPKVKLSRMHDVYKEKESHETRVFRSKEKALKWPHHHDNSLKNMV